MALLTGALTSAEVLKRTDPKGRPAKIVELLRKKTSFIDDARWKMGNTSTGNVTTVRTSLPTSTKRKYNQGVAPTHSTTAQLQDDTTSFVQYSTVDCDVADQEGNSFEFRASEAKAAMMGLRQDVQEEFMYGSLVLDPSGINGVMTRYDSIGQNVLDGGGLGSTNTSVVFMGWGQDVFGLYPEHSVLGVKHEDKNKTTIQVTNNGPAPELIDVYMDRWEWKCGLAVEDWRYIARIANIDVTLLGTGGATDLIDQFIDAIHVLPDDDSINLVIYVNRTIMKYIDKQARRDTSFFDVEKVEGKKIVTFRGHPIRVVDCVLETEERVV